MHPKKRLVDLVVISDVHLGTYGCRAKEVNQYLRSIQPKILVLNGDIIDIWQFKKNYWPNSHMQVLKQIMNMATQGVKVYYITGNHDELLRKFTGFNMGTIEIRNKLVLELNGKSNWFFHGDVFDVTMQYSRWLAKLGAIGYDLLIKINNLVNFCAVKLGKGKLSLSRRIKNSVKSAVKFINKYEETVAHIAIDQEYHHVICGHIHQPEIKEIGRNGKSVIYLNSGDWVENLTALEYHNTNWSLFYFERDFPGHPETDENPVQNHQVIFQELLKEFHLRQS